jgi:two-component system sensor histidine kinase QseC
MTSLRWRLFIILVTATGLIWLSGVVWIYVGAKAELEHVLDTRLQEAARMVSSLVGEGGEAAPAAIAATPNTPLAPMTYEHQLSCQIWSLDGQRLIGRSGGAPQARLTDAASGFSERVVDGEAWRVYAVENVAKGVRIMVGDRLGLRTQLVADLIKGLLIPALLIVPLLGALIWMCLGRGLRPLFGMARQLQARGADDMSPVEARNAPHEVKPLADALNGLFAKVEAARCREREVTAFAAHELRTPLAGLKTQAQIAMSTVDPAVRQGALRQIVVAVDRSARLVRQLLALTKLDVGSESDREEAVAVGEILEDVIDALRPTIGRVWVEIDPALRDFKVRANREILMSALRNLHENAIEHTPEGGTVSWRLAPEGDGVMVEDGGAGIPADELPLVFQRFFRGRQARPSGSGLGLAIVEAAAKRMGGMVILENRQGHSGLKAMIVLPREGVADRRQET